MGLPELHFTLKSFTLCTIKRLFFTGMASKQKIRESTKGPFKGYRHHILFGTALLSMASLLVWWSVFIGASIQKQKDQQYRILELEATLLCQTLAENTEFAPEPGICGQDSRFKIVTELPGNTPFAKSLAPKWPGYWVLPAEHVSAQIEEDYQSKNFMLMGESGFFILVLLIIIIFFYRSIQVERRTAREITGFWERSAHELKTPITGIKAFLQNLQSHPRFKDIASYVDLALKQVKRQEKLTENILSGYRLKSRESLNLTTVDLPRFIKNYFQKSPMSLTEATLKLNVEQPKKLKVRADEHALKVIFDNLTDNAVKYAGPHLLLDVSVKTSGRKTWVEFRDNGPGFEPKKAGSLFHAFEILDSELPARQRGTGMGLYISRALAREMDGDLQAFSEGKGAVFRLYLQKSE